MILEIDGETYSSNPEDIVERWCIKCTEMFSIKNPKGKVRVCKTCRKASAKANYIKHKLKRKT